MWWLISLLVGCAPAEPDPLPARVAPEPYTSARSWVRTLVADDDRIFWANYDVSTGRSARAVVDSFGGSGSGERVEVAVEPHPPQGLSVHGGYLYFSFDSGPLKRAPVDGGDAELLVPYVGRACVAVDDSGLYFVRNADVIHLDLTSREERVLARHVLGECLVIVGDELFWAERKGLFSIPKAGATPVRRVDVSNPKQLIARDGALFACVDDVLRRLEPETGDTKPIRGFCQGDGLAITNNAHWVRTPYFKGWPPEERARIVELTSKGMSVLYDGRGASPPVVAGDHLVWFGRDDEGSGDWQGYRVPLP